MNIILKENHNTTIITVTNEKLTLSFSTLGASIRDITFFDKNKQKVVITARPQHEEDLFKDDSYYGKTIGRTAGRLKNATYTIDNKVAHIEKNNFDTDNLHGGKNGLHNKNFSYQIIKKEAYYAVVFSYFSPNLEGGYLEDLNIQVTYRLYQNEDTLEIIYDAISSAPTLVNLTNHTYFNLSGNLKSTVLNHELTINASNVGQLNERLIIEKIIPVNKVMDFRKTKRIGLDIENPELQKITKGYDNQYFLDNPNLSNLAARCYCPESGIMLEVYTTYPCLVFYSNNYFTNYELFKGIIDQKYLAFCLECQFHPDGIHQEKDPKNIVTPNNPYHQVTRYCFKTEE